MPYKKMKKISVIFTTYEAEMLIFFSVYDDKHRALKVYGYNNQCLDPIGIGPFITPTWVAFKIKSLVKFFAPD